jgi:hypothetical protein
MGASTAELVVEYGNLAGGQQRAGGRLPVAAGALMRRKAVDARDLEGIPAAGGLWRARVARAVSGFVAD